MEQRAPSLSLSLSLSLLLLLLLLLLHCCSNFELRVEILRVRFCKNFVNESWRARRDLRNGDLGFMIGRCLHFRICFSSLFEVQVKYFLQSNSMGGLLGSNGFLFMPYVCMFVICKTEGLRCNEQDSICITKQ
ncbi:unnamed protein product [Camellia sinensis]